MTSPSCCTGIWAFKANGCLRGRPGDGVCPPVDNRAPLASDAPHNDTGREGAEWIAGLPGLIAAETVLSHADGPRGILWVRGHTLDDLVANFGYDGAVGLLWEGFAGDGLARDTIRAQLGAAREAAFAGLGEWLDRARARTIVEGVRLALAMLPDSAEPAGILATLPVAIGALLRQRQGAAPLAPDPRARHRRRPTAHGAWQRRRSRDGRGARHLLDRADR